MSSVSVSVSVSVIVRVSDSASISVSVSTWEVSGCLRNSLTVAVRSCSCTIEVSSAKDSVGEET